MSAQVKWERRPFWSGHIYIYLLNHLLHMGVMLTIVKVFINLFLLCLWEQRTPWQFLKQISKLSFQLSVQIYFLLGQTEGERNTFFGGCKKTDYIVRLSPRAVGYHKRWKGLSFCKTWNNPTSPLLFIRSHYK